MMNDAHYPHPCAPGCPCGRPWERPPRTSEEPDLFDLLLKARRAREIAIEKLTTHSSPIIFVIGVDLELIAPVDPEVQAYEDAVREYTIRAQRLLMESDAMLFGRYPEAEALRAKREPKKVTGNE